MTIHRTALLAAAAGAIVASAAGASAAPAVGLAGDRTLVLFDTDQPRFTRTRDVTGVDRLVGIDLRPADGTLVGVTPDGTVVSIDLSSGAATKISTMQTPLAIGESQVIVDFNPAADRLRYMTGTTNHRVNVDTGEVTVDGDLAYAAGDMHEGDRPDIAAAAYINAYGKPEKTAMYNIDATALALVQQTSPNDGTLSAIGKLGIAAPGSSFAFDVGTTADGENTAWLVTGNALYTVDLKTGAATPTGMIEGVAGDIHDIAIVPAM